MTASLRSAVGLLTVFPAGKGPVAARAAAWFPAVGVALGLTVAAVDHGGARLVPSPLGAALTLAAWIALTGALHLDGWIDVCDALAPGLSRRAALRALEDPRAGALGVVGGVTLLLVKYGALVALADAGWRPLVLTTMAARWAVVPLLSGFRYARGPEGLGWSLATSTGAMETGLATLTAVAAALFLGPELALAVAVPAASVALGLAGWFRRRLGGLTGDVYGAAVELAEVVGLVAAVAVIQGIGS